jgi:alanine racemase
MIFLKDLLAATGGELRGTATVTQFPAFCYDSRRVLPGEMFVAVKTDRGDGHDYIAQAVRDGASGVLCQSAVDAEGMGVPAVVVPDTQTALSEWAGFVLRKYRPQVVGITGSTGKTSTREAIAAVLSKRLTVFRNPSNFNGRFGVPIALAGLEPDHQVAVLELACDSFGEIEHLAELSAPQVAVVRSISEAHLATFDTLDAIALEKGRLVEALPAEGTAVLNYDDPRVLAMRDRTRAHVVTFGMSPDADLVASDLQADGEGLRFMVHFPGALGTGLPGYPVKGEVRTYLVGRHHVHTLLAALAVGMIYRVPWGDMVDAFEELRPSAGRVNPLEGVGGSVILDDTYSASPASMLAGLGALSEFPADRRVAVLGGMDQLGGRAIEAHRQIGRAAAECVDLLVTRGEHGAWIAEAALGAGLAADRVKVTYTITTAVRYLREWLGPGDVVLVKGDIGDRMEHVTQALLARPDRDRPLLVRQEPGWERVRVSRPERPTWVDIDLEAVAYNVRMIREILDPDVAILAVLKADAYGHGAVKVARTAVNNGAAFCGVASLNEAKRLREAGIASPILVLGYTPAWQAREALSHDVAITLYDRDVARAFSRASRDLRRQARAHVKVDTGMGRLGLLPEQVLPFVEDVGRLEGLELEGIFTHFSTADGDDLAYTRWQLDRFQTVLDRLNEAGIRFRYVHCANSAALLRLAESRFSMVRLGLAMYGLQPSPFVTLPDGFRPALTWKTTIAQVKTFPPGCYVSYGNTYRTKSEETIAVIPVGYADGFRRAPTRWQAVLVHGVRAPIVGTVCMDQTMVDVSSIPSVRVGDEVVLIGPQGDDRITAEEIAGWLGTINYEVVSGILARVPRVV